MDSAAQVGDAAYFESLDGLQRVVARSWATPSLVPGPAVATPEASSGPAMLSIFVFLFDTDAHAATGWERMDTDLQKTRDQDRSAPMSEDVPLEGVGDQARGYMGELGIGEGRNVYTFATVQDGPFVYSLSGMFPGGDATGLTRAYAEALVGTGMDRMAEQFNPDGTSRGGIWSKLNAVQPGMPDGTMITDFEIWPLPESVDEPPAMSMDDIATFPGVGNVSGTTYLPGEDAPAGGPSRIDAWIVETATVEDGSLVIYAAADVLGMPILAMASENSFAGSGEETEVLVAMEGVVTDDAFPEGNASVVVRQVGTMIYAAVVYAPDDTSRRIADNVVAAMIDAPDDEDLVDRFPQAGDGVLRGLVPAGALPATPAARTRQVERE